MNLTRTFQADHQPAFCIFTQLRFLISLARHETYKMVSFKATTQVFSHRPFHSNHLHRNYFHENKSVGKLWEKPSIMAWNRLGSVLRCVLLGHAWHEQRRKWSLLSNWRRFEFVGLRHLDASCVEIKMSSRELWLIDYWLNIDLSPHLMWLNYRFLVRAWNIDLKILCESASSRLEHFILKMEHETSIKH